MGREWLISAVAMAVAVLREMARLARGDDGQIKTAVESLVVSLRSGPLRIAAGTLHRRSIPLGRTPRCRVDW